MAVGSGMRGGYGGGGGPPGGMPRSIPGMAEDEDDYGARPCSLAAPLPQVECCECRGVAVMHPSCSPTSVQPCIDAKTCRETTLNSCESTA
jgi:hypothetical protein